MDRTRPAGGLLRLLGAAILVGLVPLHDVLAQRPFSVNDPFYRSETARRVFHDGIAVAGEVAYRSAAPVAGTGVAATGSALSVNFRIHYALARRIDLNAFWDAANTSGGPAVVLSWVGLKYYWSVDNADYAFRVAVDPASDGRVGFPQLDLAFISTKGLTPLFSTDFAVGIRRVRKGFRQFVPAGAAAIESGVFVDEPTQSQFIDTRAIGMEMHFMWSYNTIFDPARSNLFVALMGEGGQYDLLETSVGGSPVFFPDDGEFGETEYRGGIIWVRSGIEFNRPSYQVIPFMSVPVKEWTPDGDSEAQMQLGVRLMVR